MSAPWYIAGALAIACAGLGTWSYIQSVKIDARDATIEKKDEQIGSLNADLIQAKQTNIDNLTTLLTVRNDETVRDEVSILFDDLDRKRDANLNALLETVSHGPVAEDGPIPVVLERVLDRMRDRSAGADRADEGANRTGEDPAR